MKNRFKFTREDRRQGKTEFNYGQNEFDKFILAFEKLLFSDDCPDSIFQISNDEWAKFANAYNKKPNIVAIANPRAFYDYAICHEDRIYDPIDYSLPSYKVINDIL
jgi:transglutaminase-like putative cysteine protease